MTYTFQPLPDNDIHFMVYVLFFIPALIMTGVTFSFVLGPLIKKKIEKDQFGFYTKVNDLTTLQSSVYWVSIVVVAALLCFSFVQNIKADPPKNVPVIGVKISEQEHAANQKVGKYRYQTVYNLYVTYRVPEGEVTYRMYDGVVYPERIQLYGN